MLTTRLRTPLAHHIGIASIFISVREVHHTPLCVKMSYVQQSNAGALSKLHKLCVKKSVCSKQFATKFVPNKCTFQESELACFCDDIQERVKIMCKFRIRKFSPWKTGFL